MAPAKPVSHIVALNAVTKQRTMTAVGRESHNYGECVKDDVIGSDCDCVLCGTRLK